VSGTALDGRNFGGIMAARKTQSDKLDQIMEKVSEIQKELLERKHFDQKTLVHEEMLLGNGKPGFQNIRDKVLSWDAKGTAILILVLGDIILRIIPY